MNFSRATAASFNMNKKDESLLLSFENVHTFVFFGFEVNLFPVLCITGKTTLTESLKDTLGATLLPSPPECFSPWRARFDQEPPLIRRAFYALGNYISADQIGLKGMKTPVIVDR